VSISASAQQNSGPRVIIIRHGEKPDKGDNLSCKGFNRALQLADVLQRKFGMPTRIYTPALNLGGSTSAARMYQTIVPFAIKYNLKINTKYDVKDEKELAEAIKKQTGTVLLVWEHKAIPKILKALGIDEKMNWDDNDFDSIWIVTIENGVAKLSKDKEGIAPSAECR
jgi:hypothetical protein